MTLGSDYAVAAREMLAGHLTASGLRAGVGPNGVTTGIGRIVVDFRIDAITPRDAAVDVVFWATIDGVAGVMPPRIDLDLVGLGPDAHEALASGVHALVDGVIPVLRCDRDRGRISEGVAVLRMTSMTGGVLTAWDLLLGPPAIGGEPLDVLSAALDDLLLMQGIVDSLTPALSEVRPHWMKLFLVRLADGRLTGDVKVDGAPIGVAATFDSPSWPGGSFVVRQFGLIEPAHRSPDATALEALGVAG